jgi:predicted permease
MSDSGWRRYRSIWRPKVQQDVDDEMSFHLRMRVEEFIASGMSRDEAECVARERYGDVTQIRSALVGIDRRQRRRTHWRERFQDVVHDIAVSLRGLRREPRFALGVIATLGLGIAANATMFGVVDQLLLRGPAGVVDPARVQRIYVSAAGHNGERQTSSNMGYAAYSALRDHSRAFIGVGAYSSGQPMVLGDYANLHRVRAGHATWDLFTTLGVRPAIGRFYSRAEDSPGTTAHVAVISSATWKEEFAGSPDVLGSSILLDGERFTVVGVSPVGFNGPDRVRTDVWLPMTLVHPTQDWETSFCCTWLQVVARLAPGVSQKRADDDATRILRPAYAADAGSEDWRRRVAGEARPLWYDRGGRPSKVARVAQWLMGVAAIVLLITCANVANLMLARARRRRREIAVRLALGAGASRLIRMVLSESVLVAFSGAALALAISVAGGRVMRATLLSGITLDDSVIDLRGFGFTLAVALLVALAIGLVAAIDAVRVNVTGGLRETEGAGGGQRHSLRAGLSAVQAALSVVLLAGAGLFMLSLYRSEHVQLGFDAQRVLRADVRFPKGTQLAGPGAADSLEIRAETKLVARMAAGVARQPWVELTSVAVGSPFFNTFGMPLRAPGVDSIPQLPGGGPYISAVTSGYFGTVGTGLVRGRLFRADEGAETSPVTIVDETMARLLWPGQDPLRKCLFIGFPSPPCSVVVGVVKDVHLSSISEAPTMQYYVPLGQEHNFSGPAILIRPRGDARQQIDRARQALTAISGVQDVRVTWLQSEIDPEYAPFRLGAMMFGIFGLLALIVASVGLYSVIAYLVADRTREIGVRLALGAGGGRIVRHVLTGSAATTAVGIGIGLAGAFVGAPFLEPLLFEVHARNAAVFSAVAGVVMLIALLATWAPARRASRVDPVIALRAD